MRLVKNATRTALLANARPEQRTQREHAGKLPPVLSAELATSYILELSKPHDELSSLSAPHGVYRCMSHSHAARHLDRPPLVFELVKKGLLGYSHKTSPAQVSPALSLSCCFSCRCVLCMASLIASLWFIIWGVWETWRDDFHASRTVLSFYDTLGMEFAGGFSLLRYPWDGVGGFCFFCSSESQSCFLFAQQSLQ